MKIMFGNSGIYLLILMYNSCTWACIRINIHKETTSASNGYASDNLLLHAHNNKVWRTPSTQHTRHRVIRGGLNHDAYTYSSGSLPEDPRLRPSLANGHLGTVVHHSVVHVNRVYSGYMGDSHRAVIPSTINANITGAEELDRAYSLDAWAGMFIETLRGSSVELQHRIFAHRTIGPLLVTEIQARRNKTTEQQQIKLNVQQPDWRNNPDIIFSGNENQLETGGPMYRCGRIKEPETNTSGHTQVHVIYDVIPETLTVPRGVGHVIWTFITSIHVTRATAEQAYNRGKTLLYANELLESHLTAWESLWISGRVDIEGDPFLAKMTSSSLYYILSSVPLRDDPEWPYTGLSPNGLPWGAKNVDYLGHVFWDQDTWMFPPVLLLHQPLASTLLASRERTMEAARDNALLNGHRGLQYPWEVAFTGVEVSPSDTCAHQEIHISGDIVVAILQYIRATADVISTNPALYDIITGVADFWISKMTFNFTSDKYDINAVMGPDEYHANVNNSVYTNVLAKLTLEAAAEISSLSELQREIYQLYADRVHVPYDAVKEYHPEYEGYLIGTRIKQADAILLGYPLLYNMTIHQRRNDLDIYEKATEPLGPAMTWCMHAVGWLEVGDSDRAYRNLRKTFGNVASEFMVWTEVIRGLGAPNFLTGQGGFLQAILNGYGGIRLRKHQMDINCFLPPNVTRVAIAGLDYLGNSLDITCRERTVVIEVNVHDPTTHKLCALSRGLRYRLWLKSPVIIPRTQIIIAERTYLDC